MWVLLTQNLHVRTRLCLNIGIPYLPLWTPTLPNITKGSFSLRYGKFYEKSYTVVKRGCVRGACLSRLYSSRYFVTSSLASRCRFPFESVERGPPTFQQQQHTSWSRANPRQKNRVVTTASIFGNCFRTNHQTETTPGCLRGKKNCNGSSVARC